MKIRNNAVYYLNSRLYQGKTPALFDEEMISHIFYAFARVDIDGVVGHGDAYVDSEMQVDGHIGGIRACTAKKTSGKNKDLKVLLSITSDHFSQVAADPLKCETAARSAREFVNFYDLDGVDVYWPHIRDQREVKDYVKLLQAFRRHFTEGLKILSAALSADEWTIKLIRHRREEARHGRDEHPAKYLDFINLMCYNLNNFPDETAHQSQLYQGSTAAVSGYLSRKTNCCMAAIAHLNVAGVPYAKINLGIPLFGLSFLGASRTGQKYEGRGGTNGVFENYELPTAGAIQEYDDDTFSCYCSGGVGGFITYDNPWSAMLKADLVRKNDLAGLFYWEATGDAPGNRSVILAGFSQLHG